MKLRQIYTGPDGRSYIDDFAWPASAISTPQRLVRSDVPVDSLALYDVTVMARGLHNAPRVQLIHVMLGRIEVECGTGYREEFGPGDVLLASDVSGEGHATSVREGPARLLVVPLSDRGLSALTVR